MRAPTSQALLTRSLSASTLPSPAPPPAAHSPGAGAKGGWGTSTCRFLMSSIL